MQNDVEFIEHKLSNNVIIKNNNKLKNTDCAKNTKYVKNTLDFLYYGIVDGLLWTRDALNNNRIIFNFEEINKISEIPKPRNGYSHFYPNSLRDDMIKKSNYKIITMFKINNCAFKINIVFHLNKLNYNEKIKEIYENIKWMICWLHFSYRLSECAKTMKSLIIYFYKFDEKKVFPSINGKSLTPMNVNSAYSHLCNGNNSNIDMVLFRSEEWFKVFIHETLHAFNLSISLFSNQFDNIMKQIFELNISYSLYESYNEFWARLINIVFKSFKKYKNNKKLFLLEVDKLLDKERAFSVIQAIKVLEYNNLDLNNLYKLVNNEQYNNNKQYIDSINALYQEKETSIFAYYIITPILLIGSSEVIEWCDNNNRNILDFTKTDKNVLNFILLINKLINLECVKDYIKNIENWINKSSNRELKNTKSLRMSINEWIY